MDITSDSIFIVKNGLEKTEVPDGFVVFQAATEKVHYLNPTAAIVFELSDGTKSVGEIAAFMRDAYQLPQVPLEETMDCAQSLLEQGLLDPCPKS